MKNCRCRFHEKTANCNLVSKIEGRKWSPEELQKGGGGTGKLQLSDTVIRAKKRRGPESQTPDRVLKKRKLTLSVPVLFHSFALVVCLVPILGNVKQQLQFGILLDRTTDHGRIDFELLGKFFLCDFVEFVDRAEPFVMFDFRVDPVD